MAIVYRSLLSLRDKWFLVLVTLVLQISVCWKCVHGNCDSSCPMVCSGIPCPTSADPAVQINPLGPGTSCPEVLIYSVGYPTSYPGDTCEWKFDTTDSGFQASVMATFIDFDGESGDDVIIERTMVRPNSNIDTSNIFEGDVHELYTLAYHPFVFTRATMIRVEFRPQEARYDRRGLKLRLTFSEEGWF
ncbi:hypothetical protein BSL78_10675 [Apostichopus japonicus]|uniref:CUB domain-containing protein n=1 Tax=Stichopus japonicus TaxID=307972 RepID=A0A2G8KWT0_STIJA|nr:hypothetical protein BSL78_10675 [Apostichopus japonicus]